MERANPLLERLLEEISSVKKSLQSQSHEVSSLYKALTKLESDVSWIKTNADHAGVKIEDLKGITTKLQTAFDLTVGSGQGSPQNSTEITQMKIEMTKSVTTLSMRIKDVEEKIESIKQAAKEAKEETRWEWTRWMGLIGTLLAILAIIVPLIFSGSKGDRSSKETKTKKDEGR